MLDADALNAIAADAELRRLLSERGRHADCATVLTPHPLEAARLLATSAAAVQADRLAAAQALADRYQCTVLLKARAASLPHRASCRTSTPRAMRCLPPAARATLAGLVAHACRGPAASAAAAFDAATRPAGSMAPWPMTGARHRP